MTETDSLSDALFFRKRKTISNDQDGDQASYSVSLYVYDDSILTCSVALELTF